MALNIPLPFQLPTPKIPNYLADQKALAELPYAGGIKQNELIGKELENVFNNIRNKTAHEKNVTDIAHTRATTGYTSAQTQRTLARNPYEAQDIQADIAHKNSQAYKNTLPDVGEFQKAINDVQQIQQTYGADSPQAKLASGWLQRKAEGTPGLSISQDPATGALTVTQGNVAGAGSGKGSQMVNGQYVTPPSAQVTNEQQGRQLSNVVRDYLVQAAPQPFIGSGSNKELISTWNRVRKGEGSPEDKEKIVQAITALKLVPEVSLQQLQSQGVRPTISAQKHQSDALTVGWPESLKLVANNAPPELQKEAKNRHDQILQEAHKLQTTHYARGTPFELPPNPNQVPQQQIEMTYHEALMVQDALATVNAQNPTGKPFTQQDIMESAAKYGMTPVEFANYLKDQTGGQP